MESRRKTGWQHVREGEKAGITGPPYLSQDVRAYLLGWSEGTPDP